MDFVMTWYCDSKVKSRGFFAIQRNNQNTIAKRVRLLVTDKNVRDYNFNTNKTSK